MSTEQYDFNAWDSEIDTRAVALEVAKAQANTGGQFEKLPYGTYIVAIDKLELGLSKAGKKQMLCTMVVTDGDKKGRLLFAFFGLEVDDPRTNPRKLGFKLYMAIEFLKSLKTSADISGFQSYGHLAALCAAVKSEIDVNKWEYQVRYAQNKGYDTYTIEEKFEPADADDNIPF